MKTKELKKQVEEFGYDTLAMNSFFGIYHEDDDLLLDISKIDMFIVGTTPEFYEIPIENQYALYRMATEYASTPVEEREEPKKYIYRLPVKNLIREKSYLLRYSDTEVRFDASSKPHVLRSPTYHFADAEVEAYPEEIQALFRACVKEEVK